MNNLDSWQLVQLNEFEKACKQADLEFEQTKSIPSLRHKLYALLHLKDFANAAILGNQIIELRKGETDFDFEMVGLTYWLLNKKEDAIAMWQKGQKTKYTDAAGGVEIQILLYFGSIKMDDAKLKSKIEKNLQKLSKSKIANNWPGPLVHYILGSLSEENTKSLVAKVPGLQERQSCQLDFVTGVKTLKDGNINSYKTKLQNAVSYGTQAYLEPMFYLAKHELSDLLLSSSQQ